VSHKKHLSVILPFWQLKKLPHKVNANRSKEDMLRKIRRQYEKVTTRKRTGMPQSRTSLRLENLERRVLLDTAGWWDELGWRGASGGGVTWDRADDCAEAQLVLSVDGDPIVLWSEGTLSEYVGGNDGSGRMPFHFETEGPIYARQFGGEEAGWWNLTSGSGDTASIATGKELDAVSGPNGQIVLVYNSGGEIYANEWDGTQWNSLGWISDEVSTTAGDPDDTEDLDDPVAQEAVKEKPSVAVSSSGEIFVSYTSHRPLSGQREIIVKKYGYDFTDSEDGPPQPTDLVWVELANEGVEPFIVGAGQSPTGGVSNNEGNSYDSSIAVDIEGQPIVAWVDATWHNNTEIFAKLWDGDSWEELGLYNDSGSASDIDGDGEAGVSNDQTQSMQPDVAVAPNGDVIVTWVNWGNWAGVSDYSESGIFVKVLHDNSSVWEEYAAGSAEGAGIAQRDDVLPETAVGLGWYYSPEIEIDSEGRPFIVWQGYGEGERYTANRFAPLNDVESPMMGVYASHYESGEFKLLYDPADVWSGGVEPRGTVNQGDYIAWMPTAVMGENDELVMAYTWHDTIYEAFHLDDEIFAQVWDPEDSTWDTFGRGSDGNGNDVIGNYPDANDDPQLGLIDYDGDSSTEPDVMSAVPGTDPLIMNSGSIYRYSRDTGRWTDDIDISFGETFDLRGEPEYEYQVDGNPLLAYLDDVTFEPYVYEWMGGAWNLVGDLSEMDGAAGEAGTLRDKGISVQAGPNGTILLVYLRSNEISDDLIARLWDPQEGSWSDAGGGMVDKNSGLEAAAFDDFTGFDFDVNGDFDDGEYNDDNERVYELWGWRYWDVSNYNDGGTTNPPDDTRIEGTIETGAGYSTPGWVDDKDGSRLTDGIQIAVIIEEEDGLTGAVAGTQIEGEVDHQFRLINESNVIIEMMYDMDSFNMGTDLYLCIDGKPVDVDPSTPIVLGTGSYPDGLDPIHSIIAGDDVNYTSITIDSKGLEWWYEEETDEDGEVVEVEEYFESIGLLAEGSHVVSLRVVSTVTCPDYLGVVERDDPDTADEELPDPGTFPAHPGADTWWTFLPDVDAPYATIGQWGADAGSTGAAEDGGMTIQLGDGAVTGGLTGEFEHMFYVAAAGDAPLTMSYQLITDADIPAGATLDLIIDVDGTGMAMADTYQVTGDSQNTGYQTLNETLAGLTQGNHELRISAVLSDAGDTLGGIGYLYFDNVTVGATDTLFNTDPADEGWSFAVDDQGQYDDINGGYAEDADINDGASIVEDPEFEPGENEEGPNLIADSGGLAIILDNSSDPDPALIGALEYDFCMGGGPITISFDTELVLDADIDNETLTLMASIDGIYLSFNTAGDEYIELVQAGEYIVEDWGSITIPSQAGDVLSLMPGMHTLRFEAKLTNDNNGGAGVGTVRIDNLNIKGPQESHTRVDNFAVYQRVVPQSEITGGSDFTDDPVLLTSPVWSYSDVFDPDDVSVEGVWEQDAGGTGSGDGALVMTLGDGLTSHGVTVDGSDLEGQFDYIFQISEPSDLKLNLSYQLQTGEGIGETDTLDMKFAIDDLELNTDTYQITEGGKDSGWRYITIDVSDLADGGAYTTGSHTLSIYGVLSNSEASSDGTGMLSIDNVAITSVTTFGTDPLDDTWGYLDINDPSATDPGGDVHGVWQDNTGETGALPDGSLKLFLGDGINEVNGVDDDAGTEGLEGYFTYTFTLDTAGYLDLSLDYNLETGKNVPSGASLVTTIILDDELVDDGFYYTFSPDTLSSPGIWSRSSGWQTVTLSNIGPLEAGKVHTLQIGGLLSTSGAGELTYSEDFSADVLAAGIGTWGNSGDAGTTQTYDGADDLLEIKLNDDGLTGGDLEAQFTHGYTLDHTDDLIIEFDYEFETGADSLLGTNTDETLSLEVWLDSDGDLTTLDTLLTTIDSGILADGVQTPAGGSLILDGSKVDNLQHALEAGLHTIVFKGIMTDTTDAGDDDWGFVRIVNVDIYEKSHGVGVINFDNVDIKTTAGNGDWEMIAAGGDVGGNDAVGLRDNSSNQYAVYDDRRDNGFQADIHSSLAGAGTQRYLIEDVQQNDYGQLEVMFRYRVDSPADASIRILLDKDGVYEEIEASNDFLLSWASDEDWWNGDRNNRKYTWVQATIDDVPMGEYTVVIEMSSAAAGAEFWIDNLTVLATEPTNAVRPMATLAATGGQDEPRAFAVGVMNSSEELRVYAGDDKDSSGATSPWPDGLIITTSSDPQFLSNGYNMSSIFELHGEEWEKYGGDSLSYTQSIDFLGVGSSEGASMKGMPKDVVLLLEDMIIGPNQVEWVALQRAETDWVDTDDDGTNDAFYIYPWTPTSPPTYFNLAYTDLVPMVWRWVNTADPAAGIGWRPNWEDTGFVPQGVSHAYTSMQMVSSGGQQPVVAWTQRGSIGTYTDSAALRWEGIDAATGLDVWGVMGSAESVQNGQFWSGLWLTDMIVVPDGDPMVSFGMGHLDSYGIREFREDSELPVLTVSEESGVVDDDKLEFGQITLGSTNPVDQNLRILNNGPGELVIQDIIFGGYGSLSSSPFSLLDPPEGFPGEPVRLEPLQASAEGGDIDSIDFIVRFDPIGVPVGLYDAILVIQSNDAQQTGHPSSKHPFSHFYEVSLQVEVVSESELEVDNDSYLLVFEDSIIDGGGLSDLTGRFQQGFTVDAAGDVGLNFDYRLLLGERLLASQTLDMIVSVDGVDVTVAGDYQIEGGDTQDGGYETANLTLSDLGVGEHVVAIRGELSSSLGWGGGTGQLWLDNIVIGSDSYNFSLDPGESAWRYVEDLEDPQASDGDWDADAGATGGSDGGLKMVLGVPQETQEVVLRNTGESPLTIQEWIVAGDIFYVPVQAADGTAGAVANRFQLNGTYIEEIVSSSNYTGADDDVILNPGDYLTLLVVFEPTDNMVYDQAMYITSDVAGSELVVVRLTGNGVGGANILIEVDDEEVPRFDVLSHEGGRIDFGSVIKGETKSIIATISNDGSSNLTVTSVLEFSQAHYLRVEPYIESEVLAPGESIEVTLIYDAPAAEPGDELDVIELQTMLQISSDDRDLEDMIYNIEVVGLAVPAIPMIELIDTETGEEIDRLDMGGTYIGQPIEKTFQVKNIGGADVILERFWFSENPDDVFDVSPENDFDDDTDDITIEYGDDPYLITVMFTPAAANAVYGNISVNYYDQNGDSTGRQLLLKGVGAGQQLKVTDDEDSPILNGGDYDFGSVGQGQTIETEIIVTNVGSSDLSITSWALTEGSTDVFLMEEFGSEAITLDDGGGSESITVGFTPDGIGEFSGTMVITSNDPNNPEWTIYLAGEGATAGEVTISGDELTLVEPENNRYELDFGDPIVVSPTSRVTQSFIISNNGGSDMRMESIEVNSGYFRMDTSDLPTDGILESGEEYEVGVTFYAANIFDSKDSQVTPPVITVTISDFGGEDETESKIDLLASTYFAQQADAMTGTTINWPLGPDGTDGMVRVILVGRGQVTAYPSTASDGDIGLIELTGTNTTSTLLVLGPWQGARIGGISGGLVNSIITQNVSIDGDMDDDGLEDDPTGSEIDLEMLNGLLMLGDIEGGADISIANASVSGAFIMAGEIGENSDVEVNGGVSSFMAKSYGAGGHFKVDDNVSMMNFTGLSGTVAADFEIGGDLGVFIASQADFRGEVSAANINMFMVGEMNDANVVVEGKLGLLYCLGDMDNSRILAGYDSGADGQLGGGDDSAVSGWQIGNLLAMGRVSRSYVLGGIVPVNEGDYNVFDDNPDNQPPLEQMKTGKIGMVLFGNVLDNAPTFGIAAYGDIGTVLAGRFLVSDDYSPWTYFQVKSDWL
jgi:HYDIN/CFA65/VesB-like, Ig-like domain